MGPDDQFMRDYVSALWAEDWADEPDDHDPAAVRPGEPPRTITTLNLPGDAE